MFSILVREGEIHYCFFICYYYLNAKKMKVQTLKHSQEIMYEMHTD